MRIDVEIPEPLANALQELSQRLDMEFDEVVVYTLVRGVGQKYVPVTTTVHERIVRLVKQGLCDADIATLVHHQVGNVATVRRAAHLPANPRYTKVRDVGNA